MAAVMPRRTALLSLALAASLLPALAQGGTEEPQVPCFLKTAALVLCADLVVDPDNMADSAFVTQEFFASNDCAVVEGMVPFGSHRLLKFTFTTPNLGTGDLVVGSPSSHPDWFEWSPCHGHYHFRQYADYRLWTPAGWQAWSDLRAQQPQALAKDLLAAHPEIAGQMVAGDKRGFCVIDIAGPYLGGALPPTLPKYFSCGQQGISVGWADEYHWALDGQWVVVDGLAPGTYMLESEVNAEHLYEELDYANNPVAVPVQLS